MGHRVKIKILTGVQGRLEPPLVIFTQYFLLLCYYYALKKLKYQDSNPITFVVL